MMPNRFLSKLERAILEIQPVLGPYWTILHDDSVYARSAGLVWSSMNAICALRETLHVEALRPMLLRRVCALREHSRQCNLLINIYSVALFIPHHG